MKSRTRRLVGSTLSTLITGGGEFYFLHQHNDEMALACLVLGLISIVVVDQIIALFGKDIDDVISEIGELKHLLEPREFYLVGDDEAASRYTTSQHPFLKGMRDTHMWSAQGLPQFDSPHTYVVLKGGVEAFLKRPNTHLTLVTGNRIDKAYIQMFISALDTATNGLTKDEAAEIEKKVACRRLRTVSEVLTNFIILDYKVGYSEVLFGWRQHIEGCPGSVFRSRDKNIVREFSAIYDLLCLQEVSEPVSLRSLLHTPADTKKDVQRGPQTSERRAKT